MSFTDRSFSLQRETSETEIEVSLGLDGEGVAIIDTGFGMLNHMLELLAFWADFNLELKCRGDLHVDAHHTLEDIGICLGNALIGCLGEKKGINRVGYGRVPMDEALAEVTVDLSGRPWLVWRNDEILPPMIAREEKDIWREFYKSFCSSGRFNLHVCFLYGKNGHHLLESVAKGCGIALKEAVKVCGNKIKSTKGELE